MLETALSRKKLSLGVKVTVKSIVSAIIIACAVVLPMMVHAAFGVSGGVKLMPMYLPVIIGAALLGKAWGSAVGILAPMVSFAVTSLAGNPMPALSRLPFMMAELLVFALVCGAFSKKITQNKWFSFVAVISAQLSGRAVFLLLAAIFQRISPISFQMALSQITQGAQGLLVQAALIPLIVIAASALLLKDKE